MRLIGSADTSGVLQMIAEQPLFKLAMTVIGIDDGCSTHTFPIVNIGPGFYVNDTSMCNVQCAGIPDN